MELKQEVKQLIKYRSNSLSKLAKQAGVGISTLRRVLEDKPVSEGMLLKLKRDLK